MNKITDVKQNRMWQEHAGELNGPGGNQETNKMDKNASIQTSTIMNDDPLRQRWLSLWHSAVTRRTYRGVFYPCQSPWSQELPSGEIKSRFRTRAASAKSATKSLTLTV